MRTTKVISFSLSEAQYKKVHRLARKEHRTMSELMREALRTYEAQLLRRSEVAARFGQALSEARSKSAQDGADSMTMEEIDKEISAARRETRQRAKFGRTA